MGKARKRQPKGKLESATGEAGPVASNISRRLFVRDTETGENYLIDTGAALSIIPYRGKSSDTPAKYCLYAANGTKIDTYGESTKWLKLGTRRTYPWTFVIAKVSHSILGADFLAYHNLLVDLHKKRLIDQATGISVVGHINTVETPVLSCIPKDHPYSQLLSQYPSLSRPSNKIGKNTTNVQHFIETKGPPVFSKARRLPPDRYKQVKQEFERMMEEGICRPSNSAWSSPLHVVPKKDGSIRPCGDYRLLNNRTVPDRYGVPNLHDFSYQLKGTSIYSTLDINRAYHHIDIAAEDVPKTAIITPFGLFEFTKMTFGLRNAAQTFQRFMDGIFRDLNYTFVYLDDILVASRDEEEHTAHLKEVLQRLADNGLTLNISKCAFGQNTVTFLGYKVNQEGITPLPEKVQTIQEYPRPTNITELRRFLGMVNFYRRSLPHAATVQKELNNYLHGAKKNDKRPIDWTTAGIKAFEETKQALVNATCLAHPDPNAPWTLACDASDVGMGAVLQQRCNDSFQPLGFFSRTFNKTQLKYSTYDRELLSIFEAIRHFRYLLEGRTFTVETDHKPLTYALKQTSTVNMCPRRLRQLNFISQFTNDIRYKSGPENVVADALSRVEEVMLPDNYESLVHAQQNDETVQTLQMNNNLHLEYVMLPGCKLQLLCERSTDTPRPYLPKDFRRPTFNRLHDLSHPGIRGSRRLISQRFFWPGMNKDIGLWARSCIGCQTAKVQRHTVTPLQQFQPSKKFEHVHIDLIGPLPPSDGKSYCLTMIDRGTRWPEAIPLRNIEASTVAKAFYSHWVSRFGVPVQITTDQGRQFESMLFNQLTKLMGIARIRTTAYHPQSNGCIERWHRTLKAAIMAHGNAKHWTSTLPIIMLGLRTALKEDDNVSVAERLYGHTLRLPGEFFAPSKRETPDSTLVGLLRKDMAQQIRNPDPNPRIFIHKDLAKSAYVFLRDDTVKKSLDPPYKGPYKVLERDEKTMKIELPGREARVSLDRVKPAHLIGTPGLMNDTLPSETTPSLNKTETDAEHSSVYRTRSGRAVKPTVTFTQLGTRT